MESPALERSGGDALANMPKLNIVIMGFGSRGDLEPTLEIAKVLQFHHGHRVRYVTHERHRPLVQAAGIEFYSLGRADPREMIFRRSLGAAGMRKLLPQIQDEFFEMGQRFWGACIDDPAGMPEGTEPEPFVADAIIATMTTFVHSSAAARMGIPIHLQANNPRIYSKYLPHSQAESSATSDSVVRNVLSWWLKDLAFLLMLNSGFNRLRVDTMGLETFSPIWWTSQFFRFRLACTNLWSPHLLPSPADWGDEIDTAGFVFADPEPYTPPVELTKWLQSGDEPIYVGFGSMSFPNTEQVLQAVFGGITKSGRRVIFAKGWCGIDPGLFQRDGIFIVDEIPHHWLFPRVAAVVIHMGAGTFSLALKLGKPIIMIPIAGDQPFWSHRVFQAGCSPEPIPLEGITSDLVATRVQEALSPEIGQSVKLMADKISKEEPGQFRFARSALNTFQQAYVDGRCDLLPDRVAVWKYKPSGLKLSVMAASILLIDGLIQQTDLSLIRHVELPDLKGPGDPLSGIFSGVALLGGRFLSLFKALRGLVTTQGAVELMKQVGHVAEAPVGFLHQASYGLYNLVEYLTFKLGGVHRQQFDSNLWSYSYPEMLSLLLLAPIKEISPWRNTFMTLLLSPVRFTLATANVPIGFLAFTLRLIDRRIEQSLGYRPKEDTVYNARMRQGRQEMGLAPAELHGRVVQSWRKVNGPNLAK
ncbi:Glyco-transf-28 domain-containing protein [Fusarium keratoplasticum]|uniref:Glyco-transf-28 domain-containing protein n=1 Tax=Fusarium keratoplasticum TaxID=1328300 RepID=A0ACC0QEX4_9HYPO|nr:Glyco-transf-28 domain-containing protein [Fusarium keratoplasticum]KAI8652291.1 Glyco-transf-28 domain-containing protein [Fusarium keratoplasticum]KAI8653032.1 Glyco-transf-28 domain-containing protein [Fusarium keratoplasticum]